jgi:uncharacterized protein involved in type VI secretion and phage assembly
LRKGVAIEARHQESYDMRLALQHDWRNTMDKFPGVLIGIVKDVTDPDKLGRVRVLLPALDPSNPAGWAQVVRPYGVSNAAWFNPEPGDQVLVAFESGDARKPIVLGTLWNPNDRPPIKRS